MSAELELAWAAGFFDGEGSCHWHNGTKESVKEPGRKYGYIVIDIAQVDRRPLDRFKKAVGCGKIYGPYNPKTPSSNEYYRFTATRNSAFRIIDRIDRHLSGHGKDKIREATEKWIEYQNRHKLSPGPMRVAKCA